MAAGRPLSPFAGAVLAGGASRRMGRDKAFIEIDGAPLVARVADALRAAGATRVIVIGGAADRVSALGLDVARDEYPGEGPLGGVITALHALRASDLVAVLATDLVAANPHSIRRVVGAAAGHDVAVPVAEGRRHFHHAVWQQQAETSLARAFASGERAIKRR
jgi:molybdopterin-guanine dinucleotide biosynthesis protein A